MKKYLVVLSLLPLAVSACHPYAKHHKKMVQEMDIDGDGFISKKEWDKFGQAKFREIDVNKDNKLDSEEFKKHHKKMKCSKKS